ncbi:unnamed protein product [Ilex paraguariensis]|uniref:Uncharacterized protein n=1 Tax=Ilex paraguariensis TaxID=185542 RepID=A0ABC8SCV1_9AQUA
MQILERNHILHLQPLIYGHVALGLYEPCTTVIALDVWPSGLRSPEPATSHVERMKKCEHWFLDLEDGQAIKCLTPEIVNSSEVVKLHG